MRTVVEAEMATGPTEWDETEYPNLLAQVQKAIDGTRVVLTKDSDEGIFNFRVENPEMHDFEVLLYLAKDTVGCITFTFLGPF